MSDLIDRQEAIDAVYANHVSTNPDDFSASEKFIEFMDDAEISSFGRWKWANGFSTALVANKLSIEQLPSAEPERKIGRWIIHKDWLDEGECGYECPNCGRCYDYAMNFCGFCGAKMEVEHE